MNERIRDLLIKSGFATGYDRHHRGHWILSDTEAEKFAELIVRECSEVCKQQSLHYAEHNNKGSAASAAHACSFLVKLHFGVK